MKWSARFRPRFPERGGIRSFCYTCDCFLIYDPDAIFWVLRSVRGSRSIGGKAPLNYESGNKQGRAAFQTTRQARRGYPGRTHPLARVARSGGDPRSRIGPAIFTIVPDEFA